MPWCGTYERADLSNFIKTFTSAAHYCRNEGVELQAVFGSGDNVTAFGTMTLRSKSQGIATTTPLFYMVYLKVNKITFMQFMKDIFSMAATFRSKDAARFVANPDDKTQNTS
jgi:hypothetical protein